MLATRKLFGIGDPLIVRSPVLAELGWAEAAEVVSVHQPGGGVVQVDVPQVQSLVGVCNLLAVGRPRGSVKKRRWITQVDVPDLAQTILAADIAFVGGHSEYLSPRLEDRARARG